MGDTKGLSTRSLEIDMFAAAETAADATSPALLITGLEQAFARIGLAYFSVFEAVPDGASYFLRSLLGKRHKDWSLFYGENGLYQDDMRVRHAVRAPAPFFCSEVLDSEPDITPRERRMFELARSHGLVESYVLPYRHTDRRIFAVVSMGAGAPIDATIRVAANLLSTALLLGALRIEAELAAIGSSTTPPLLRRRQLECLEWSRRGKSSADTAKILDLSPRTVDEHIAAACKALDVRTRVQAVSQALAIGLLPYETT